MSADAPGGWEESQLQEAEADVTIDAESGEVSISLDKAPGLIDAVRAARRRPSRPIEEDDPHNVLFLREIDMLLRMTKRDALPGNRMPLDMRDELLGRLQNPSDIEAFFDDLISTVLTQRTLEACSRARLWLRLAAAALFVYEPDLYTEGAFDVGRHFYFRAESQLVANRDVTTTQLQHLF